jgi:hypothetical protein
MINKINKQKNLLESNNKEILQKYVIPAGIGFALTSISVISEAADPTSVGIIKNVVDSIVNLIKNEGKYGLQILSAAGGGLHAAKTSSWQPLLVGAGAAGIIEVLFQAIK